jgi:chromosomal replication initiation ATPase DnaA
MDESKELLAVLESSKWPPFLGGKKFLEWVKKAFFENKREKEVPDSVYLAPDLSQIKAEVCDFYRVHESVLQKTQRGVANAPRDIAIYLARMLRQEGLQSIGKNFGLSNYSSVSTVIDRVKSQMDKNRIFRSQVEEIERKIKMSQPKT